MAKDRILNPRIAPRTRTQGPAALRSPGWFAKRPAVGLGMFVLGSLVFGALAYNVTAHGPLLRWDVPVLQELHARAVRSPDPVIEFFNASFFVGKGLVIIIAGLLSAYYLYKRYWRELALSVVGMGGVASLWFFFSRFFGRLRPPFQMGTIVTDPSFPSGHAATAVLCYGLLAYIWVPRISSILGKWLVTLASLLVMAYIGFGRLFLGAHYPSDIVAGYSLGIAWAGLVFTVIERLFQGGRKQHGDAK
ncbi:MAG: phosphatase PAP2 family protein [Bacteroidota bacterium]